MPPPEILVRPVIVAMYLAAADQLRELLARLGAAAPGVGVIVDAVLVELRRVDAVEPVGDAAELDGIAVPDHRACGECPAHDKHQSNDKGEGTDGRRPRRKEGISGPHACSQYHSVFKRSRCRFA
jgi:hypothetical protein